MTSAFLLRLILLLPLAGAILNGVTPLFLKDLRTRETLLGTLGTAVVAVPFVIACYLFVTFGGEPIVADYFTWMAAGDLELAFAYRIDELSLIMTLVVTGVGGIIHFYSLGYMHGDSGYWRFFSYLNLFIFAMLNLVLANNLPVLFLGWEGVGLCSYLLIGFWYTDPSNSTAANKAFIVNRVGDFAFLVAMFLIFRELGGLGFDVLLAEGPGLPEATLNWIILLLFIGATGKSAQIPLFVWLPDAMAGPTPVSALIHAATMVTSGLYLLARISELVLGAPVMMAVIAIVGAATALMAATIAIAQNDIKRVLAYSTVSQLGYMFMAAGVGAFFVSIFHLVTHAFFKACLFLCSGSAIHGMEEVEHDLEEMGHDTSDFDPQDMRTMGGLGEYMPTTRTTYLLATLAISGIPLTAGFFSKDEVLFKAFEYGYSGGHTYAMIVWIVGILTAVLTAFYMMRSYMLTFEGEPRWPRSDRLEPHESPATMTGPLWTLGILSVIGGFIGLPAVIKGGEWNWIHHYLGAEYGGPVAEASVQGHVPLALEWGLILLSSVIALGTVYYAWRVYTARGLEYDALLKRRLQGLYQTWEDKYYWDDFYNEVVVNTLIHRVGRRGFAVFDDTIVDGAVNGVADAAQGASGLLRRTQTGIVQNYALALALGAALVVGLMLAGI
ncbi:MAG: NADH-quinone oxidoreductase subunit L [Bacteroidetes bacterium QH_10_64_37]|nr:MAG: NADH-quinone oxidoreductase subunit L [Bacteroidetes bacterium QH_10_64_37]